MSTKQGNLESSSITILMFVILILLTAGLIVEHSRLSIIPLTIGVLYGASLLRKYAKGEI